MTATPIADTQPVPVVAEDPKPSRSLRHGRRDHLRRAARLVIGTVLVLAVAYWIFEGPVASLWYQTRQDHLASDFNVARTHVKPGEAAAILQIPRIGLNVTVGQGDSPGQLRAGPGHRPGTPLPGSVGNSVVFGHEHAWGGPFDELSKLHAGDSIYVESHTKQTSVYTVTAVKRTSGSDAQPLAPTTDTRLTLVTGTGGRLGTGRLVVSAVDGRVGHVKVGGAHLGAAVAKGSLIFNRAVGSLIVTVLATVGVVFALRRSHRSTTVAIIAFPIVLAALLALMIEVDLFLSPLA